MNYSLLVMESAGMMKMATGEGSPLRRGAGIGSRLVFGGYRGLRWRKFRSRLCSGGFCIYKRFWHWEQVRGARGWRARPGGGRAPYLVASLKLPLRGLQVSRVAFLPKITSLEGFIPFRLRLIFLFFETLKQGKKQKLSLGSGLIG